MNFSQMVTARIGASTESARCLVDVKLSEPTTALAVGEPLTAGFPGAGDGVGIGDGVGAAVPEPLLTDATSPSGMTCVVPSASFTRYSLPNLMTVPSTVLPFLSVTTSPIAMACSTTSPTST